MEDNFRDDDFEQYVRGQADQHRMFPSEKVWGAIDSALHPRKKWYGFGLAFLLLLTGGAVTWVMSTNPVSRNMGMTGNKTQTPASTTPGETTAVAPADLREIIPFERSTLISHPKRYSPPVPGPEVGLTAQESLLIVASSGDQPEETVETSPAIINNRTGNLTIVHSVARQTRARAEEMETMISINADPLPASVPEEQPSADKNIGTTIAPVFPLTIESVLNSFRKPARKLSWQFFITPTVSYRKLSENKDFGQSLADPLSPGSSTYPFASMTSVNNAVTHKPDLGLQVGLAAKYPLSPEVKLIGGLQFNINRYDIKAFRNNGEVARIELDGNASTVVAWSSYRSQSGNKLDWLKNIYFSVSAPIGAELLVYQNRKKTKTFGIAGTIQPTYMLRNKSYLISTDYKNYTQVPWLTRNMNISTSFETFVQYNRGKTQLQVGPQVRYQLLSSFNRKYPIRENLFDFGMKIALTLNR